MKYFNLFTVMVAGVIILFIIAFVKLVFSQLSEAIDHPISYVMNLTNGSHEDFNIFDFLGLLLDQLKPE